MGLRGLVFLVVGRGAVRGTGAIRGKWLLGAGVEPEAFLEEFDEGSAPDEPQGLFSAWDSSISDCADGGLFELAFLDRCGSASAGALVGSLVDFWAHRNKFGFESTACGVL
jgi:hypothetical protein